MTLRMREKALNLAAHGFFVFPLNSGSKIPIGLLDHFKDVSTRDAEKINSWWTCEVMGIEQPYNVGISCHGFGDFGFFLVAVDVDVKEGKQGDRSIFELELQGKEFPETFTQFTPTGGRHLLYYSDVPVSNSTTKVASGIDVRGFGGYVAGAGSVVEQGEYKANWLPVEKAPTWLLEACAAKKDLKASDSTQSVLSVNTSLAVSRAFEFLEHEAPVAIEGQGGNATSYAVASHLKDLGLNESQARDAMLDRWNSRCVPPWTADEISRIVANAYKYGKNPVGAKAPERVFDIIPQTADAAEQEEKQDPVREMNKEFAFVISGGRHHILWETKDAEGRDVVEHLDETAFHRKFAGRTVALGSGKVEAITKAWMSSHERRSYDGFCFRPELPTNPNFYNLWRGFAVQEISRSQASPEAREAVDSFFEHALENVCEKDEKLWKWLIGYFAHLVQKPWEKPLTALVFRGQKGVGKNALVDRVGHLLGQHYMVASNKRYLVGNFNSHLENCLMITLDEAFWSGDKQAEGILKDLITGTHHVIEHKGQESYRVENRTRAVVIGNEEWLVPATEDERRYAVFDVGNGRKQDRTYFRSMREGMERGGYGLLLWELRNFRLAGIDVDDAPRTQGLLDQKLKSQDPFFQWWLDCLHAGSLVFSEFSSWQTEVPKESLRHSYTRYWRERHIKTRIPDDRSIGHYLKRVCPSTITGQRKRDGDTTYGVYQFPELEKARHEYCLHIGHSVAWA